jgi:hypothetical protein
VESQSSSMKWLRSQIILKRYTDLLPSCVWGQELTICTFHHRDCKFLWVRKEVGSAVEGVPGRKQDICFTPFLLLTSIGTLSKTLNFLILSFLTLKLKGQLRLVFFILFKAVNSLWSKTLKGNQKNGTKGSRADMGDERDHTPSFDSWQ